MSESSQRGWYFKTDLNGLGEVHFWKHEREIAPWAACMGPYSSFAIARKKALHWLRVYRESYLWRARKLKTEKHREETA